MTLAEGNTANKQLAKNPRLRELYEMYILGRSTTLTIYEKPVGRKGETVVAPIIFPTGIHTWPRAGGLYDQDYVESRVFAAFLRGDVAGTQKMMNKIRKRGS